MKKDKCATPFCRNGVDIVDRKVPLCVRCYEKKCEENNEQPKIFEPRGLPL